MWAGLQTPENPKNSVLRDRNLTGRYEKGVILINKISHIVFDGAESESEVRFLKFFHLGGLGLKKLFFKKPGLGPRGMKIF